MNGRWELRLICAAAVAACGSSMAHAKDDAEPALSFDPINARSLLAPVDEGRLPAFSYRLDPGPEPSTGQRARLSVELGQSTLFAITGRLKSQPPASGPLDPSHARIVGQRRPDSGKVYGGGIAHKFGGVDVSATYQYSKLRTEQAETEAGDNGPGKSHSLRATARIRFGD